MKASTASPTTSISTGTRPIIQPLTPLTFLERAASVFPDHSRSSMAPRGAPTAISGARSLRLASALAQRGIGKGDTVSVMLANTPAMLEAISACR